LKSVSAEGGQGIYWKLNNKLRRETGQESSGYAIIVRKLKNLKEKVRWK